MPMGMVVSVLRGLGELVIAGAIAIGGLAVPGLEQEPALAQAAPVSLAGPYTCEGTNPDGTIYEGVMLRITDDATHPGSMSLVWDQYAIGIGQLTGHELRAMFDVSGWAGEAIYDVSQAGRLDGRWRLRADGLVTPWGTEFCIKGQPA